MSCISEISEVEDLKTDDYTIGYFSVIAHRVEPSHWTREDFAEVYTDEERQDIRPAINLFEKLTADIGLEDEELGYPLQHIDDPKYRYINADRQISNMLGYALARSDAVLDQIMKRVEHEAFKDTIQDTYELFREYPL